MPADPPTPDHTPPYAEQVLKALVWPDDEWMMSFHDLPGLMWNSNTQKFLANCSDTFYWACADVETIELEDLPLLRQTLSDCWDAEADDIDLLVFVCRKRKMRPMDQLLDAYTGKSRELLEAAGPARPKHDEDAIWHGKEGTHG